MVEPVGRIFVAVPLPDEVRLALADRLAEAPIPGRVVPPENWHLTLRFLGRAETVPYERFLATLDQADRGGGFRIRLGGLGAFPSPKRATVTWVAISEGQERLADLASLAEEAARAAGFPAEERPYRAHLTLSRVRPPQDVTELVTGVEPVELGWHCESMVVYRSHLSRGGPRYEALERFALDG